jgi:hypothetical protein
MSEKEKLSISRGEYNALDEIRGLEATAYSMVVLAQQDSNGRYILEGAPSAFDALQSDLADEIYHELSPPTRLRQLRKLYDRLSPDNDL